MNQGSESSMFEMSPGNIFFIDRSSRAEGMPLSDEAASKQPQRTLPKILVVDDERRIADTLAEILDMSGFTWPPPMTVGKLWRWPPGSIPTTCSLMCSCRE